MEFAKPDNFENSWFISQISSLHRCEEAMHTCRFLKESRQQAKPKDVQLLPRPDILTH